jgi:ABC-type transport system substrate-binding protein
MRRTESVGQRRWQFGPVWASAGMLAWLWCAAWLATLAAANEETPLYTQEPFDLLRLNPANRNAELKLVPLDLPERRLPENPRGDDELEVRLLDRPDQRFRVKWQHIVEVRLFEEMILAEAERLLAAGDLDGAYPYYRYLQTHYPALPRLADSIERYLTAAATSAFRQSQFDEALAMVWALHARNPDRAGLATAAERIADRLVEHYVNAGNYEAARRVLGALAERFAQTGQAATARWRQRLEASAQQRLTAARQEMAAGRLAAAAELASEALAMAPHLEPARQLAAAVGLTSPREASKACNRLLWNARRSERLLWLPLAVVEGSAADGMADFRLVVGTLEAEPDQRRWALRLNDRARWPDGRPIGSADVACSIAEACASDETAPYNPLAAVLRQLDASDPGIVSIELSQPVANLAPWLAIDLHWPLAPLSGGADAIPTGPYRRETIDEERVRFVAVATSHVPGSATPPQEVMERVYADSASALRGLRRGEVAMVDRLAPWMWQAADEDKTLTVAAYGLAEVHALVPNRRGRWGSRRAFRHAVSLAVDPAAVLAQEVLSGRVATGIELATSLLEQPAGPSGAASQGNPDDPKLSAAARRHDATLARVMFEALRVEAGNRQVWSPEFADAEGDSASAPAASAPDALHLVLVHPAEETARVASRAIAAQLARVGARVTLRECQPSESLAADAYDLAYVIWSFPHPARDVPRLVSAGGMAGDASAVLHGALLDLAHAERTAVASALARVNAVVADEVHVIPLWRYRPRLVHNDTVTGVGQRPITLYDNVSNWRVQLRLPNP